MDKYHDLTELETYLQKQPHFYSGGYENNHEFDKYCAYFYDNETGKQWVVIGLGKADRCGGGFEGYCCICGGYGLSFISTIELK